MRGLLMNLVAKSESLLVLTETHLTYHYGDDRSWLKNEMLDFQSHNIQQAEKTYKTLIEDPITAKRLHALFDKFPKYRP